MGQIGHSSPQQESEEFTAAYMGSPPPTRWSIQRANGKYKDHLVGQLSNPYYPLIHPLEVHRATCFADAVIKTMRTYSLSTNLKTAFISSNSVGYTQLVTEESRFREKWPRVKGKGMKGENIESSKPICVFDSFIHEDWYSNMDAS